MSQQPIGQRNTVPSDGFDQGEHGAGVGVSNGLEGDRSGVHNQHPIADKFMGSSGNNASQYQTSGQHSSGTTAHTARDNFSAPLGHGQGHEHSIAASHNDLGLGAPIGGGGHSSISSGHGITTEHTIGSGYSSTTGGHSSSIGSQHQNSGATQSHHHTSGLSSTTSGNAVSGAYAGGGTRDALTGESHASTTGAGVGPLGENLHQSSRSGHAGNSALAGTAAGATAAAGSGLAHASHGSHSAQRDTGAGVGPAGGAGGHYTVPEGESTSRRTEATGQPGQSGYGGIAAGAGAGAAIGAGASGASHHGQTGLSGNETGRGSELHGKSTQDHDSARDLDTGGPHSLVFQESTGKYVHRRDL